MDPIDNTKAAVEAGKRIAVLEGAANAAVHRLVEDVSIPFVIPPVGCGSPVSVEGYLPNPVMRRSIVQTTTPVGFIDYVKRFKDADTVVFADLDNEKFEAVIDYHQPGEGKPRWGKHRVLLACVTTDEWDEWTAKDKSPMSQVDFARFIEERVPSIAEPDGATLLEMCLTLEAKKDVSFRSSTRLGDGQHQFKYEETISGKAGVSGTETGQLDIPDGFKLVLKPFVGSVARQVEARFRYRINNGTLSMWFELVRPSEVLQAAFDELAATIKQDVDCTVIDGVAPTIS